MKFKFIRTSSIEVARILKKNNGQLKPAEPRLVLDPDGGASTSYIMRQSYHQPKSVYEVIEGLQVTISYLEL